MFTPRARMKLSDICNECEFRISQSNVPAEDIDISKGQAKILTNIANSISKGNNLSKSSLKKVLETESDFVYLINSNWGTSEYFINLALNQKKPNPISLIMYFLNLKNKINNVPTKIQMRENLEFELSDYEEKFGSWEQFLDLLGLDPWYRKENNRKELQKLMKIPKKQFSQFETDYFNDNDSYEETIEKINKLRKQMEVNYQQKDSDETYSDYSYVEMFQLLEKYLKILPKESKYGNIKNLI